jgi:hypothetical protein
MSDTNGQYGNGNASATIGTGYQVVQNDTVTVTNVGTTASFLIIPTVNEIGNVKTTDAIQIYHEGQKMPGFDIQTSRGISTAGSLQFKTPATFGASINLYDRIEFGYRGHESFYGWAYSIDKSSEYIYQITAYDGGYGMAMFAGLTQGVISRAGATMSVSGLLGNYALQVVGLGASKSDKLGVNVVQSELPVVFGWNFSGGQVLQKIEAVALGFGYVSYTDYLSNMTLSNYQIEAVYPYGSGTVVSTTPVGTVLLRENTDGFVVQSKKFNPSEKYGFWQMNGLEASGATLSATVGVTQPQRTMGTNWLLVQASDATLLGTIANTYYDVFENGVWTVTAWSKRWFDTSGVDVGGSIASYIGDDRYLIMSSPSLGIAVMDMSEGGVMFLTGGAVSATYVRNSESPQICAIQGSRISEVGGFLIGAPGVLGTIGTAGTLAGQSMDYDGLDTLYTATPSGTVYATNWYNGISSVVATIGSSITTILAPAPGVAYVGTPSGVVRVGGGTIDGTSGYHAYRMFYDSTSNLVYICAGTSGVVSFLLGATSTSGTLTVSYAVPEGVFIGCALQDGSGGIVLGGTVSIATYTTQVISTVTVGSGTVICDMVYDTAYSQLAVLAPVSSANSTYVMFLNPTALGTPIRTAVFSGVADQRMRVIDTVISRQNLYTLQFADGTTLYNCIVATVQVTQMGTTVTFTSGQVSAGAFAGPTDPTQLSLWNVVTTMT